MSTSGITVHDELLQFPQAQESVRVLLAQISPAYDQDVFAKELVVKVRDPERQAERITGIIRHAASSGTDLLLFPELVAPFCHLPAIEEVLRGTAGDFVACIPYEHTTLRDFLPLLSREETEQQGLTTENAETRLVNISRIFIRAGEETKVFTQIKLTPFSGEFSLSAKDTLVCGNVLHRFITNWGTFVFLICKDYVGEVRTDPPIPMFDFLKSLTADGLHYVFVSALNPEPEAFLHAARSFYYLQEKSSRTYSVFLNGAELDHTAIVFPAKPHPGARTGEHVDVLPLFETKPGWGTHVRFPGEVERLIGATLVRLDAYTSTASKEIYSPAHGMEVTALAELGVPAEAVTRQKERRVPVAHNLPPELAPFIDREEERARVASLLDDPSCRLLTLVGPGGIGKTRLALRVAVEKYDEFSNGAWFIPLAPTTSHEFLVSRVGESLGFSFFGRRDPEQQLLDYLRQKEMLLLLDNFEHLLAGADLVQDIIQGAPRIRILVTSRERLNLRYERVFQVGGMSLADGLAFDRPEPCPAVRLFVDAARRTGTSFMLSEQDRPDVLSICQLLGGMPLAIELAASWVRVLPPRGILEEIRRGLDFLTTSMRDVPERHRSIRAVFEHSWDLLSEQERQALMKLSVFRGGFSRRSAEAVAGVPLITLSLLIDKSLVRLDASERYDLLEVLRHYAYGKLTENPERTNAVRDGHSSYYAEFLRQQGEEFNGERQRKALDAVSRETENIQAGWQWALERVGEDTAMVPVIDKYLHPLYSFHLKRGRYRDGDRAVAGAVERLREAAPATQEEGDAVRRVLGRALARQAALNVSLGGYAAARRLLEEGVSLLRASGCEKDVAFALNVLSNAAVREGRYEEARGLSEECLRIGGEIGDQLVEARALDNLGNIAMQLGDYGQAKELHERALAISRALGYLRGIAVNLNGLGNVAYNLGEVLKARAHYEESLSVLEDLENRMGMSVALSNLGNIAMDLGEYTEARDLLQQSLEIARDIGFDRGIGHGLYQLGNVHQRLGNYDKAQRLHEDSLAVYRRGGDRRGEAYTLRSIGKVLSDQQRYEEARSALEESLRIFRDLSVRRGIAASLVDLAGVARALGDSERVVAYLREALTVAMEIGAAPMAVAAIVIWALVLKAGGECQRAARLCEFALAQTAGAPSTGLRDEAEEALRELAGRLSAEELEAVAAGQALTLREVAYELLGEEASQAPGEAVS
jgi:predicted ATPase/predicted amidohydrolase/Tfp pilus assembly protein PilF